MMQVREPLPPHLDLRYGLAGLAAAAALWCVLTYGGYLGPLWLPTPTGMWEAALEFHRRGWLLKAIGRSGSRVLAAVTLMVAIGAPLGVLMGSFAKVDAFLRRLINAAKAVPTTGLMGLIILWFSIGEASKIAFLFLGGVFYMIVLTRNAVVGVSDDYVRVAKDIGVTRWQTITRVLVPGALPQIWEAAAVCLGICWTYIVLAEFVNNSEAQLGLGFLLYAGTHSRDSAKVYLALALIGTVAALSEAAMMAVRRRWLRW